MKIRLKTIEGEKSFFKNYIIVYHKKLKKDFPPYFKMSLIGMKELDRNISKKNQIYIKYKINQEYRSRYEVVRNDHF